MQRRPCVYNRPVQLSVELQVALGDDLQSPLLQHRGRLVEVFHRETDGCSVNREEVNPCREKKLTNIRTTSADDAIILQPPRQMSLEQALEYIEEDEYVEVTPKVIRLRKQLLSEAARKRGGRLTKQGAE
jgi:predicted membrane GTPase involved in stress response